MTSGTASKTLAGSMRAVASADDFDYAIANFLDRFKIQPDVAMVTDEPPMLAGILDDEGLADAYVAAVAAHLCQLHELPCPRWANEAGRIKQRPWFAAKTPDLRAILLQESPAAFRLRNLFVSANALSRA